NVVTPPHRRGAVGKLIPLAPPPDQALKRRLGIGGTPKLPEAKDIRDIQRTFGNVEANRRRNWWSLNGNAPVIAWRDPQDCASTDESTAPDFNGAVMDPGAIFVEEQRGAVGPKQAILEAES